LCYDKRKNTNGLLFFELICTERGRILTLSEKQMTGEQAAHFPLLAPLNMYAAKKVKEDKINPGEEARMFPG
jgi:hypothetical protein